MLNIDENTVMHGIPYKSVAFLWRTELSANVSTIEYDDLHRCVAIQIAFEQFDLLCFELYLSCFAANQDYEVTILQVTANIESIIMQHVDDRDCRILICGDFNFDIDRLLTSDQLAACRAFINGIDVAPCDVGNIIPRYTYRSATGAC